MKAIFILIIFIFSSVNANSQDEVKQIYYLDKEFVDFSIEAYYVGCKKKVIDTTYTLKWDLQSNSTWEVFYDKEFKIKQADYYTQNDTTFAVTYYRNSKKKSENRHDERGWWIYKAEWCENGQLISSYNPNDTNYITNTTYYCNGNKKWQGNLYQGRAFGVQKRWYENGQLQSERNFIDFNKELAKNRLLKEKLLSEQFWDENGNEIEEFPNSIVRINTLGAPIIITKEELNGQTAYFDIKNQKAYDNTMSLFRQKVYQNTTIENPCKCEVGLVYVSFTVNKKGQIKNLQVDNKLEDCAENAFIAAINKIKKWQPATFNGQVVETKVKVALELEKVIN